MWKTNHETIGHNNKMKIQTLYARGPVSKQAITGQL